MSVKKILEDGQWDEYRNAMNWVAIGSIVSVFIFLILLILTLGLTNIAYEGFSKLSIVNFWDYLLLCFKKPWHVFVVMGRWMYIFFTDFPAAWFNWLPIISFYALGYGIRYTLKKNPHRFMNTFHGSSSAANFEEAKKMGLDGKYMLICSMGGKWLRLNDTRSAICVGSTNEGKTESVVIPAILTADEMCVMVHESGILFEKTSGHRATLGPVFMLNFSKVDDVEKKEFYPSWNPLASGNIPLYGPGRYNYISALCFMLIKDGPTGADPYWAKAGRSALEGFVNYLCDKCDSAKANDYFLNRLEEGGLDEEDRRVLASYYKAMPDNKSAVIKARENLENNNITKDNYVPIGKWDPIPEEWHGHQSNLATLIDMVTLIQMEINDELKEKRDSGDPSYYTADPWNMIIENMLKESVNFGYSRRAILELNQILNLPGKQRSSVLSTGFAGIAPFKNTAIRQRTAMNDFTYKDLRGMKNPETGEYHPVTIYVNSSDPYGINSVFLNINTGYLMSYPPNVAGHGPYPMFFALDNFHRMDKMPKFIDMVGMGRSQKVSFLIVVQDLAQVNAIYSENDVSVLMTNCSIKMIKRTNNPTSSERFSPMIGMRTVKEATGYSYSEGFFGKKNNWNKDVKYRWHGSPVQGFAKGVLSGGLNRDEVRILVQGYSNRPIKGDAIYWKKNEKLSELAQIPKAAAVSEDVRDQRDVEDRNPPLYVLFETGADKRNKMTVKIKPH